MELMDHWEFFNDRHPFTQRVKDKDAEDGNISCPGTRLGVGTSVNDEGCMTDPPATHRLCGMIQCSEGAQHLIEISRPGLIVIIMPLVMSWQ
jgi:hypothetical protein